MPTRNSVKLYVENAIYHVYNRGVNKENIFGEEADYIYFLYLFKRHLSSEARTDNFGREYVSYKDNVELLQYCLMPNHYHLLILNTSEKGLEQLMRSVMTAYSSYFNRKYNRVGHVFQGRYLAAIVSSDEYLLQVSRYIHLNPLDIGQDYRSYDYSSWKNYGPEMQTDWLNSSVVMGMFSDAQEYAEFVEEDKELHEQRKRLGTELAHL